MFSNIISSETIYTNEGNIKKINTVIKSLISITKNDFTYCINKASLLSVSSKLCSIVDIITLSDEATYRYQKEHNILFHVAAPSTNSLEYATNDLR